jgi:benzoyl-CoA reductase/2-hydroxyglutaryl-CoA dehydratase subunit BcrC/BadD/HgdB
MTMDNPDNPTKQFHAKALEKQRIEMATELDKLVARSDYCEDRAYFLNVFRGGISLSKVAQRAGRPIAAVLCVQAPLEIFHAFGFHPFKIFSGSHAAGQLAAPHLPALTCPMLRSALGALELEGQLDCPWIIPTTCDWVTKFPEMAKLSGNTANKPPHWMELPRLKDSPRARDRWFSEVMALSDFLSQSSGHKLNRKTLLQSIAIFKRARQHFSRLIALRRVGFVPAPWFFLIAASFFMDSIENWTAALEKALPGFNRPAPGGGRIFLSGSPIFFPNFKLLHLLEEAGLLITGDDLCSSERIFPANIAIDDPSNEGILRALAESYHQGCMCPTFGDSEHRINNIRETLPDAEFKGIVFHTLKGCHPYDIESLVLETPLKEEGLRFLRVETDYAVEDSQNILTRLEAFRRTLDG